MSTVHRREDAPVGRLVEVGELQSLHRRGPTVLRIILGAQLRRLREAQGVTREQAGAAIRATHSKISRLELGRTGFKQRDVADLLTLYRITDEEERETLLSLAHDANRPGWWHLYSDVMPSWLEAYVGLEEAAAIIRNYEVQFVHGLLQTPDYARSVVLLRHADSLVDEVDRRVELRMRRQQLLVRENAPKLWVVLDESALHRALGGRQVMRAQLQHLLELSALPNVTIQIVPFASGGHAAAGGPFTILRFPDLDLPDVVYLEQLNSALYLDKRSDVEDYMETMERLCVEAEPADTTPDILNAILKET